MQRRVCAEHTKRRRPTRNSRDETRNILTTDPRNSKNTDFHELSLDALSPFLSFPFSRADSCSSPRSFSRPDLRRFRGESHSLSHCLLFHSILFRADANGRSSYTVGHYQSMRQTKFHVPLEIYDVLDMVRNFVGTKILILDFSLCRSGNRETSVKSRG